MMRIQCNPDHPVTPGAGALNPLVCVSSLPVRESDEKVRLLKRLTSCRFLLMTALLAGLHSVANAGEPQNLPGFVQVEPPVLPPTAQNNSNGTGSPAVIFQRGKLALQNGQLALAEEDFRRVLLLDPDSGAAYVNLGVTYMREKRWEDALRELRKARSLSPQKAGILLNIGLVYYRENDFSSAIESLSESLSESPNSVQARYLLGLCYFFTNQYKEAAETLNPLWETESTNLNYLYVLTIAASRSLNSVMQGRAFDRMLAIGQNKPEFRLYLGKAWLAEGDTGKALGEFNAAVAARPGLPLVHYFLGRTYLERHEYSQAEAELEKDAAIEPDFAYNYEDLGILDVLMDQPQKAEQYFRKAIERNKALVNSYFGLAKLYRDQARYKEALEMADRTEALAPKSASVHFTRGQILKSLGQPVKANLEFREAAMLNKSFNDRLQQDQSADRLADAQEAAQE